MDSTLYDKDDVAGLLMDRLKEAREQLDEALEAVRALCELVQAPRDTAAYLRYFCAKDSGNAEQLKANEPNRLALYKHVASLVRAFADLANELPEAGYSPVEISAVRTEVDHYEKVRNEVKLAKELMGMVQGRLRGLLAIIRRFGVDASAVPK